uniref:Uncharacterized protein n=1 Tax=Tanacetum cinerariifolium TaxID=118510 RepID=A0A6L2MX72_TANCI|nr:hypothetical protein [Tanacetum cinerariifolium]
MSVTRIARSFGLLTNELTDALSIEPSPHVFKQKSLIAIGVITELQNGMCVWPAPRAVKEEEEAEDEAEGDAGHGGVGVFADIYRNKSQGDWQVLQIDSFIGYEADYPPYGYHRHMPPGYAYHPRPSHDGSS